MRKKRVTMPQKARFHVSPSPSSSAPSIGSRTQKYADLCKRVELRKRSPKNRLIIDRSGNVVFLDRK